MALLRACIAGKTKGELRIEKAGLALIEAWLATSAKGKPTMRPYKKSLKGNFKPKAFN